MPDSVVTAEGHFPVHTQLRIVAPAPFTDAASLLKDAWQLGNKASGSVAIYFEKPGKGSFDSGAYTIHITPKAIRISALDATGALYAVQTLVQLDMLNKHRIPAGYISDKPRFSYRGLMLDVSRNFYPASYIKKLIDLLALYKINTFHWHLTDGAGWRIEIKKYPELTTRAAWRTKGSWKEWWRNGDRQYSKEGEPTAYGGYYTQEEASDVVAYAAKRGITVIPEIEMPGHADEVVETYPHLKCAGVTGRQGEFCLGNDSTFTFMQDVLTEIMQIFPSPYLHIGGDEASKKNWKACARCQQRIRDNNLKDEFELQSYAIRRMEKFISARGRYLLGWDEILEGGLAPGATVMSWRGEKGGIEAAKQDHDVIMTPVTYCYFDYYQHDPAQSPEAIGGFLPLEKVYSYEPLPAELPADKHRYIKGVQGNVWTEYIATQEQLEYMIFPRIMALAEVGWTKPGKKDWNQFKQRMYHQYGILQQLDVNYCRPSDQVDVQPRIFADSGKALVTLGTEQASPEIRYTLDGSAPSASSALYGGPFVISGSALVKAAVFRNGKAVKAYDSLAIDFHLALGKPVTYLSKYSSSYPAQKEQTLVNGYRGTLSYHDGQWQGFLMDMNLVIDLGEIKTLKEMRSTFMQTIGPGVYLPDYVEIALSDDGVNFTPAGKSVNDVSPDNPRLLFKTFTLDLSAKKGRYVKFFAKKHSGFLFADEIIIY